MNYPRGTYKAFRKYLNKLDSTENYKPWKNGAFRQQSREYGDYLYFQDRAMFDNELFLEWNRGWRPQ